MIKKVIIKGIHETLDLFHKKEVNPTALVSLYDGDSIHDVIKLQSIAIRGGHNCKMFIHAFHDVMESDRGCDGVMP